MVSWFQKQEISRRNSNFAVTLSLQGVKNTGEVELSWLVMVFFYKAKWDLWGLDSSEGGLETAV